MRPKLKPDAIPSIFPDLPEFILKMVKKRRKLLPQDLQKKNSLEVSSDNTVENDGNKYENHDIVGFKNENGVSEGTNISNIEIEIKSENEETEKEQDSVNDDLSM